MENLIQSMPTMHQDMIHDINFNYFGTRMATTSSDKFVKIWNKDTDGQFKFHSEFKAQDGPIWKVKWSLPEFGNIVATCSFDKTVCIYEEKKEFNKKENKTKIEWIKQYTFHDAKESVEDVKFGPRHPENGQLVLAVASKDGIVRIYRSENDISLKQWQTENKIQVSNLGVNCITWNKSPMESMMLAVGTKYNYQFNTQINNQAQQSKTLRTDLVTNQNNENPENSSYFFIYERGQNGWQLIYEDKDHKCVEKDGINDMSWVAQNGKDYHLIAICGKFGLKVIKFTKSQDGNPEIEAIEILKDIEVWRVSWNIMGTLLSCSDNNNQIRVFQVQNDVHYWKLVCNISDSVENGESNLDQNSFLEK